ncbi:MAG: Cna B-type domain-containing protein [Lachnospiraceae bacterium]|nr:Cna B-type domain-containing protein [Lachnospiraceae bacterium]
MRIKTYMKRLISAVAAAALLFGTPLTARADNDPIVDNGNGKIAIVYRDRNNDPISGMRVRVYQVASATGRTKDNAASGYTLEYQLKNAFRQFDENTGYTRITGFSEEALNDALIIRDGESDTVRRARWQRIAASLAPYATAPEYGVTPQGDEVTEPDGTVTFTGLSPGLYLLIADGLIVEDGYDDYRYSYDPAFVALPGYTAGVWDYGVNLDFQNNNAQLRQKYRYDTVPYEFEIFKRWVGDDATLRPAEVIVDIYRDGVLYQTVTLNEGNGWHYSWTAGSRRHIWSVVERATAQSYSVSVVENKWSGTFTLTNTYNPPPPPPDEPPPPPNDNPPPPEEEDILGVRRGPAEEEDILGVRRGEIPEVLGARRLPQTGQLWWPVPLLAIGGIGLFAAGLIRRRRA